MVRAAQGAALIANCRPVDARASAAPGPEERHPRADVPSRALSIGRVVAAEGASKAQPRQAPAQTPMTNTAALPPPSLRSPPPRPRCMRCASAASCWTQRTRACCSACRTSAFRATTASSCAPPAHSTSHRRSLAYVPVVMAAPPQIGEEIGLTISALFELQTLEELMMNALQTLVLTPPCFFSPFMPVRRTSPLASRSTPNAPHAIRSTAPPESARACGA